MSESAAIGILTTDTALVVRSWNAWLAAVTGIAPEAACGRPLAELAPGAAVPALAARLAESLSAGTVQVLSPAFHQFFIPCPPQAPSRYFSEMQQSVHIGPLLDGVEIAGLVITITDVTAQRDAQRALAADDWRERRAAVEALAPAADHSILHTIVETLRQDHRNFNALSSALKLLALSDGEITLPLVRLLADSDADLRIQAALALGGQHDRAATDALIGALSDPDVNVRFHAIEALGRLHATDAIEPLLAILDEGDFFLAFAAIDALSMISDPRVAPRLAAALGNQDLQDAIVRALGALGDDEAVTPLAATLNASPDGAAGIAAALAAIELRQQRQFDAGAHVPALVRAAVDAAGERHLLAALETSDPAALAAVVRVLGWLRRDTAAPALAQLLGRAELADPVVDALLSYGEGVLDLVARQLDSDDPVVKSGAITILGRLGSRRATPMLVPLLRDTQDVAIAAAGALALLGDRQAFDPLLDALSHPDAAVRQSAVAALNSIGHPEMPARITALMAAPDPHVRESAVRIAGYFGYPQSADAIIRGTQDPAEPVRVAALEQLPFLEDPRALDVLRDAVLQSTPKQRAAAARALGRIREGAARTALAPALADPDPWVRYYAVRSMAEHGDPAVVPLLLSTATGDPAMQVRIAALDALGSLGDPRARDTLLAAAADRDDDLAAAALQGLGAHDLPEVLVRLNDAARSGSPVRRRAAIGALGALGSVAAVDTLQWLAAAADEADAALAVSTLGHIASRETPGADAAVAALVGLQGDAVRYEQAAVALSQLPSGRLEAVAQGLQHDQVDVRQRTVETLGRCRSEEATGLVASALADAAPAVREAAVLMLMRLGARGVDARLASVAENDPSKSVRRAAASALARLRHAAQ